jgi:16S rRNA (uracil1498-N3)-methyltransferase
MADPDGKIRLFVAADLAPGAEVPLTGAQAHYLFTVMRRGAGARVAVFNGRDGEWAAEVAEAGRRGGRLVARAPTRPQGRRPDLWLAFAPVKKARTDFIVEKATELGAARIQPVVTRFTAAGRPALDRLRAHAVEAAEQCGETSVPEVAEPARLGPLLDAWDPARRLIFADETREARPAAVALAVAAPGPWAILVGPEGGFAPEEAARLRRLPFVLPVALGPRILRADTAALAALVLWQAALGDWRCRRPGFPV